MKNKTELAALMWVVLGALHNAASHQGNPLRGVPSGHLYAQLIDRVNIEGWNRLVSVLTLSGQVTESNHLLTITPKGEGVFAQLESVFAEIAK